MNKYREEYYKYKQRYVSLKIGGRIIQQSSDTGAGVILIENYKPKNQQNYIPCVILFRDKKRGTYSDGGGNREHGENLQKTAARELKEESANMFRLSPNTLTDNNAVRHNNYVCYFLYIRGPKDKNNNYPIFSQHYYDNMKIINNSNAPSFWKETDSLVRVSIQQFIQDGGLTATGDLNTVDTNNNKITIMGRTKGCIRNAINDGTYDRALNKLITLNENKDYKNSNVGYLNGTKTYWT